MLFRFPIHLCYLLVRGLCQLICKILKQKQRNVKQSQHTCVTYKIIFSLHFTGCRTCVFISVKTCMPIKGNTVLFSIFFLTSSSFFRFIFIFFLFFIFKLDFITSVVLFSGYTIFYAIFSFVSY